MTTKPKTRPSRTSRAKTAKDWKVTVRVKTVEPMTRVQVRYTLQSVIDFTGSLMFGDGFKSARVTDADQP